MNKKLDRLRASLDLKREQLDQVEHLTTTLIALRHRIIMSKRDFAMGALNVRMALLQDELDAKL